MRVLDSIKGLLFDLDGVLYVGNQVIEGAPETIQTIKRKGIKCRFVTNTTTKSKEDIHTALIQMGFNIEKHEIINPPYAAVYYLRQLGSPSCFLLLAEEVIGEFSEFRQTEENPDVIILGDIGDSWNYNILNKVDQCQLLFPSGDN